MDSETFVDWLEKRHDEIMACEAEALKELAGDNVGAYKAGMKRKAEMLASLSKDGEKALATLPPQSRARAAKQLEAFSRSARTALSLDSVFYMGALLYPDDYKKGEPDNLALFIEEFKRG